MKRIAVFCGSKVGNHLLYQQAAKDLAREMVANDIGLVFGGGKVGLMGIIADEMMALQGEAIGVIPEKLMSLEVGHKGLSKLIVVNDMHERKAKMNELSDGFICLAGGIGTLEEIFEVFTWAHIGYHQKPMAVINTNQFYNPLNSMLTHLVSEGFLEREFKEKLLIEESPQKVIDNFLAQ